MFVLHMCTVRYLGGRERGNYTQNTAIDMIYGIIYLTAVGLTPCGSSTVDIYTQTIHRTKQSTQKQCTEQQNSLIRKSADRALSLRGMPWHLPHN
jgi:hypothetical protein